MQTIPAMLREREVLGIAPTGSGKTLAFALPILHTLDTPKTEGFRAIVVSPTRELADQIYREFIKLGKGQSWKICRLTKSVELKKKTYTLESSVGIFKTNIITIFFPLTIFCYDRYSNYNTNEISSYGKRRIYFINKVINFLSFFFAIKCNLLNSSVEWLIFDEADKLFEEQFIEQVDEIITACDKTKVKVCLFSATMLPQVEDVARTIQRDPIKVSIGAR